MADVSQNRRKTANFEQFVRDFGVEELARHLAINPSAIYHWLRGATSPRISKARKIQRLAKKRGVNLSLEEIL